MTNSDIILNAVVEAGLMTRENALMNGCPFHTFSEWKQQGKQVKKGEKAILAVWLWKYKKSAAMDQQGEQMVDLNGEPIEIGDYYKTKAYLFSDKQVEDIKQVEKIDIRSYNKMLAEQRRARKAQ